MSQQSIDRLNKAIIKSLSRDGDLDKPFLMSGYESYTKRDLIKAIENGDAIGDVMIDNLIGLTIDLIDRKKINTDGTK